MIGEKPEDEAPAAPPVAESWPADWNVVVTVCEDGVREARRALAKWGTAQRTGFYNVLTLAVETPLAFLDQFAAAVAATPGLLNFISHVVPAEAVFDFCDAAEFETKARAVALGWAGRLAGKTFHVRLHRRGFKGTLSTPREERFLDDALLAALAAADTPGSIRFEDPDAVIQIETVGGRAGMSLWTREQLRQWPFLGVD